MQNSYLKLEQGAAGKRHPLLTGLEDTPRIINGVFRGAGQVRTFGLEDRTGAA